MYSDRALTNDWIDPVRFSDGSAVSLANVAKLIKQVTGEAGIPVGFSNDQVKFGGLFNKQVEDILIMFNPEHRTDYLKFAIRIQYMGKYAFMHVYYLGGSTNYAHENNAQEEGTLGTIRKAANFFGGHNAKLQAEEQYYSILQDCLEKLLG